jgi:ankyrin repeat protein
MKRYFLPICLLMIPGVYADPPEQKHLLRPQEIHGPLRASLIHEAIKNGRLDQVQRVLMLHANPNERSRDNETTLELAIKQQAAGGLGYQMVQVLVKDGANVNAFTSEGKTPLTLAIELNAPEIAKFLIDNNANIDLPDKNGNTPIHWAIERNNEAFFKYFLEQHAALNEANKRGDAPLHWALRFNRPEMAMQLVLANVNLTERNADRTTALHQAADKNFFNVVAVLVRRKVPINLRAGEDLDTPLHLASKNGDYDVVRFLIDNGADINIQNARGETPLFRAVGNENTRLDVVEYMVTHGAVVDTADKNGSTSLHEAAKVASGSTIDVLVKHGGNVEKRDRLGRTPLYIAGLYRNLQAAKALVERHADVNASKKPLEGAIKGGDEDVIRFLIEKGAKT